MAFVVGATVNFLYKGARAGDGVIRVIKGSKGKLHGLPLPKNCCGVQVDTVWAKQDIPIPHPPPMDEDIDTLAKALGTTIAWPKKNLELKESRIIKPTQATTKASSAIKGNIQLSKAAEVDMDDSEPLQTFFEAEKKMLKRKQMDSPSSISIAKPTASPKIKTRRPLEKSLTVRGDTVHEIPDSDEQDAAPSVDEFQKAAQCALDIILSEIEIRKNIEMPRVPLCRLITNPIVRPLSQRIKELKVLFATDGYINMKSSFLCSVQTQALPQKQVETSDVVTWDPIFKSQHDTFEDQIQGTEWEFLSMKFLYVWDGNHRLAAWTSVIKELFQEDVSRHPLVRVNLVDANKNTQADVMKIVSRLNRYNEVGNVPETFVDHVCMIRGLGTSNKEHLLRKMKFTIPKFVRDEMNRRKKLAQTWFGLPLSVLSQITRPDEYTFKMMLVFEKKKTMQPAEWEELYKKEFFASTSDILKKTKHAVAIADPMLGEEWWQTFLSIDWDSKTKGVTEDRLYSLACADITNNRKKMVLEAITSHNTASMKRLSLPKTYDNATFRMWLHRDALWHNISTLSTGVLLSIRAVHEDLPPSNKFNEWLEFVRDDNHKSMFLREASYRKSKISEREKTETAKKPLHRLIYRWLSSETGGEFIKRSVFKAWADPNAESTMYSQHQIEEKWSNRILSICPFFLDFQGGAYPENEKDIYDSAIAERGEKEDQQIEKIVLEKDMEQDNAIQGKDIAGSSQKSTLRGRPPKKRSVAKSNVGASEAQGSKCTNIFDEHLTLDELLGGDKSEFEEVLNAVLKDSAQSQGHCSIALAPELSWNACKGKYLSVLWGKEDETDTIKLSIAKKLQPLYNECGKMIFQDDIIKECAVEVGVLHLPTENPIMGFSTYTTPTWNMEFMPAGYRALVALSHFLGEDGLLICICTLTQIGLLQSLCGGENWREDHIWCVVCPGFYGIDNGMPSNSLCVVVYRRDTRTKVMLRPSAANTIVDDSDPEEWLKKEDNTPWRGGLQRGIKFWEHIVRSYTRRGDIILQVNPDGVGLPAVGTLVGRHVIQIEQDSNFLDILSKHMEPVQEFLRKKYPEGPRILLASTQSDND